MNTNKSRISGMKNHDCHVLLQHLLLVAIRGYFNDNIYTTLIELCLFFKDLCSRTLKLDVLNQMKDDIIVILCKMEMIFPPTFFRYNGTSSFSFTSRGKACRTCSISLDVSN